MGTERSIEELYRDDPERADAVAFGRPSTPSRRGFLGGSGLAAMSVALGGAIPFAEHMPQGLIPAAFAQTAPSGPPPIAASPHSTWSRTTQRAPTCHDRRSACDDRRSSHRPALHPR